MFPSNVCYNFEKYNEKDGLPCLVKKYAGSKGLKVSITKLLIGRKSRAYLLNKSIYIIWVKSTDERMNSSSQEHYPRSARCH